MNEIIRYSRIIIWFILGGEKPFLKKKTKNSKLIKSHNNRIPISSYINKRRMINAGSNMGLMEDALEQSLYRLDERYVSISKVLEIPLFYDSPQIRQVIDDVKACQDSILYIANEIGQLEETADGEEESS